MTLFIIVSLFLMSCQQEGGDRFLGYYNMDENRNDTTFVIIHNKESDTYIAKLLHMRLKDYVFKYNPATKTLISSSNDTMSLDKKNALRFTNENGPRIFYKVK